jgi:enamine deaminase RidA (YjgF/YER057c/UK114 family)
MADIKIINPEGLGKPLGQYSHMTWVKASEFLFIAGQVGADASGKAPEDFDAQCGLAFANIEVALKSAGAGWAMSCSFIPSWCIRRTSRSS